MFSLKIIPTPAEMARVIVTFDDAFASVVTSGAFAYANGLGIKATVYMVTNNIDTGSYLSTAQLDTIYAANWDIGNHTMSHAYFQTGGLSQAQCEAELGGATAALIAKGYTRAAYHVAYPGGENTANSDAAMLSTGMLTGRTVQPSIDCLPSMCQRFKLPGKLLGDPTTLATAKGYIDAAIASKKTVVLFLHEIVTPAVGANQWALADFQALMDYIVATGIQALTVSQLYDVIQNS